MTADVEEPQAGVQQALGGGCEEWMCGTNSPQIAQFGFWELQVPSVLGTPSQPNNVGVQVVGFLKGTGINAAWYLPRVVGGRLSALPTTTQPPFNVTLSGSSLVNGAFMLKAGGKTFRLRVTAIGEVASWAQPPVGHVMLESYQLDWAEVGVERFTNMCTHPGGRDDTGMNGPLAFQTLLFEGDRFNAGKKLDTGVDLSWFNLGCAGSTLAKMALTGHTEGARTAHTFFTSLAERQTMLKLLTADYCGDGTPFTVPGQPLDWADDRGTMKMIALVASPPRPVAREARWTPAGAACLDKPRVDAHWTQTGNATFGPDVYAKVQLQCPLTMPPPCADATLDFDGYHLITATEPFQPTP